jgi:hypothetical protein
VVRRAVVVVLAAKHKVHFLRGQVKEADGAVVGRRKEVV